MSTQTRTKPKKQYTRNCGNCNETITYFHRHKPKVCPKCSHAKWDKPKTEVLLFDLQDQYLANREEKYLAEMYKILKAYAQSLIYKVLSSNVIYSPEKLEEKAHDAANSVIRYYLEKPAFSIDQSFGGYLKFKVKEVLYSDKDEENHESLNAIHKDSQKEVIETLELYGYDLIFREDQSISNTVDPIVDIIRIINIISNQIRKNYSSQQSMIVLAGIYQYINKKSQTVKNRFYQHFGQLAKEQVDISMKEIYNHLQGMV